MSTNPSNKTSWLNLDIVRDRWIYIGLSLLFLVPGTFFIITNMMNPEIQAPVRLGIDFTGGTMMEVGFQQPVSETRLPEVKAVFDAKGYHGTVVQIQQPRVGINDEKTTQQQTASQEQPMSDKTALKTEDASAKKSVSTIMYIRSKQLSPANQELIQKELTEKFGTNTLLQSFSIGPSLASELLQKGLLALGLSYILLVAYLTFRFEFDYALCAIVSLMHDALFVFGIFALMGHFFNTEVDSMFVTAILTVIGFSVHDTIVVYDRLRENSRIYFTKKLPFGEIANMSVNQTLARSINTSMTALLTLIALYFFGGDTTKDFVLACIMGIAVGTYSSIFVASSLLTWWREKRLGKPIIA